MEFISQYRRFTKLPEPEMKKTDLSLLVKNVIKLMDENLKLKSIGVKHEIHSGIKISCDKKMIEQVFINILKNAIESFGDNKKEKRIEVNLQKKGGRSQLKISDNGKGIPKEFIEDIFVPFFSTKESGSGIGLSLSRQIMKLHGGLIYVQSEKNIGTEVTCIL